MSSSLAVDRVGKSKTSLGVLLSRRKIPFVLCGVYIVRRAETILYVGSTRYGPRERLRWHWHERKSQLGQLMRRSDDWREWIVEWVPLKPYSDAAQYERELIVALRPELNGKGGGMR